MTFPEGTGLGSRTPTCHVLPVDHRPSQIGLCPWLPSSWETFDLESIPIPTIPEKKKPLPAWPGDSLWEYLAQRTAHLTGQTQTSCSSWCPSGHLQQRLIKAG